MDVVLFAAVAGIRVDELHFDRASRGCAIAKLTPAWLFRGLAADNHHDVNTHGAYRV